MTNPGHQSVLLCPSMKPWTRSRHKQSASAIREKDLEGSALGPTSQGHPVSNSVYVQFVADFLFQTVLS